MGPCISQLLRNIVTYRLDNRYRQLAVLRQRLEEGRIRETAARRYLNVIKPIIEEVKASGNLLERPPTEQELYEDRSSGIELGALRERPDIRYIHCLDQPGHTLIMAGTGFGKTSLLRLLAKRIYDHDRQEKNKSDDLQHQA